MSRTIGSPFATTSPTALGFAAGAPDLGVLRQFGRALRDRPRLAELLGDEGDAAGLILGAVAALETQGGTIRMIHAQALYEVARSAYQMVCDELDLDRGAEVDVGKLLRALAHLRRAADGL